MRSTELIHSVAGEGKISWLSGVARKILFAKFTQLQAGQIVIKEHGGEYCFGSTQQFPIAVEISIDDPAFYADVVFGGSIGAGESYMAGNWQCNSLTDLIRIMLRNREVLDAVDSGASRFLKPLNAVFHWLHRNSLKGSRRNIAAHYDLGNEMFAAFLDPTMTYSSGIFTSPDATMEQASLEKLDRLCQKLELKPSDHLLEIGTGWGSMAIHAASQYGCCVTTTTISEQQYQLAVKRVEQAGLTGKVNVLLKDYRELEGRFDKLVSIEMIEAIGHQNYGNYFQRCSELLIPEGVMAIQAITIADQRFEAAANSVDFIQRHIFPGSCIPSVSAMAASIAKHSDMKITHLEDIGPHYATTLARWREQFFANIQRIRELGYPAEFERMWEFYLCYCEAGFEERALGDVQMVMAKPLSRQESLLGNL